MRIPLVREAEHAPPGHMEQPAEGDGHAEARPARTGERLREERRVRGLTLADAERDTRINRLYLEAIEEEDFRVLPAPVYARGFVRSYARYLGFDPDEAARAVPGDLPRPPGMEPATGVRRRRGRALPAFRRGAVLAFAVAGALALAAAGVALLVTSGLLAGVGMPAGDLVDGRGVVPPFRAGETPDFTGAERDAAVALLEDLGLRAVVIDGAHAAVPAGRVYAQSPSPGASLAEGGAVMLFVSKGQGD